MWGFWHTPLWLVASGYSGTDLFKYIGLFLLAIISTSVIIATFYNLNRNLLIPIVIHLIFNFSFSIMNIDRLQFFFYIAPLYASFAIVLIIANPKKVLYGKRYNKYTKKDKAISASK